MEIAKRRNLYVIEDACEAIGAEYDGRKVGAIGDIGVFGFYPNKQITTGEGGAVVSNDPNLVLKVRELHNQGRCDSNEWFRHSELGYNYRISDINCALGIEQLKRIDAILDLRESIANKYNQLLMCEPDLRVPQLVLPRRKISWFVYVVLLSNRFNRIHRDRIVSEMKSRGIAVGRYFAPIHLQPIYLGTESGRTFLPVTESCASRALALPFFNRIKESEIAEVCHALHELILREP
jgi:perosamine synthetase